MALSPSEVFLASHRPEGPILPEGALNGDLNDVSRLPLSLSIAACV